MSVLSFTTANGSPDNHDPFGSPVPALRVERPWGWFETLVSVPPASPPDGGGGYAVKRLWISPRCRISLQRHHHRSEHWVVVSGHGELECGDETIAAQPGTTLFVPVGAIHRASAGADGLLIVEVQRGDELREDDIERVEDDYGRVVSCLNNL
ncbi:MAG: phosphomannose isomerase type II C-terminal cupin domain [Cyanobacteria bacterium]|nr:phosphomannose isomerase type II C-terminal cupin domain [Cyanobacteriota bacterium]